MVGLPTGTLTLLFTDIEGSTRLLQRLGDRDYGQMLGEHHRLLKRAIADCGGVEVKTEGDSFFAVFDDPARAIRAAVQAQRALAAQSWPQNANVAVRMGVHTGQVDLAEGEYVGLDVHRAARISDAGHGGQVLISETTYGLIQPALGDGLRLRDLGAHRLKDLPQPEHLYQLVIEGLPAKFPPPRSLEMLATGLPQQLTAFFGRERELAETRELLAEARLLTLSGTGGTGKTRLALQLATDVLGDFPDGVHFVPLAALREADLVLPAIAQSFEVNEGENLGGRLVEAIGSRQLLLILDNFEQVMAAASDVAQLLTDTPRLKIMVTSRARLNLAGEREYVVPALVVPDPHRLPSLADLAQVAAIALFVDRARAVSPEFRLTAENAPAVADICARVDGLPLAIELAAARVRLLSPDAICDRLSNRLALLASSAPGVSERQRTLRGTIQWSYDLLADEERALFRRLAVFRGGAPLPLVARVMGVDDELEMLEKVGSLIDKSLARRAMGNEGDGAMRVEMLESIREFARERLEEEGEADAYRERHAVVYLDLLDEAEPKLTGDEGGRWLDRLEQENDNLRAVFDWALDAGRVDLATRLCEALWRFWQMRGHLTEGRERAEQTVEMARSSADLSLRASGLSAAGSLAYWQADWPAARAHYKQALDLQRQLGKEGGIADALYNLSFAYVVPREEVQHGMDLAEESLTMYRRLDDRAGVAKTLWALGSATDALPEPRYEEALDYYKEASEQFEIIGNRRMLAWSKFMSAGAHAGARRVAAARAQAKEALRIFVELGDVSGYVLCIDGLAVLEWIEGRRESAVRLAAAANAIAVLSGVNLADSTSGRWLARFGLDGDALDPEAIKRDPDLSVAWQAGAQLSASEAVAEAGRL
jgi:predicted ATPase/class 3 adenylate cyclase